MSTRRLFKFFALPLAIGAATAGCSASPDDSSERTDSATSDYSSFRSLGSDSYSCTVSSGATKTTATISRTLSQRIANPSEHILTQTIDFAEPVFTAATSKLGPYGCWHDKNEGWSVSSRLDSYAGTQLPSRIAVDIKQDLQWRNCDYEGTETASVTDSGSDIRVSFSLVRDWGGSVAFSGTCTKNTRAAHSP